MILTCASATNSATLGQAIDEFHCAVMAKAKPVSEVRKRGPGVLWETFQNQQQLMLLRFDPFGSRRFFAIVQEFPDTVAELSKSTKAKLRNIRLG
jgi:hypothetical protein